MSTKLEINKTHKQKSQKTNKNQCTEPRTHITTPNQIIKPTLTIKTHKAKKLNKLKKRKKLIQLLNHGTHVKNLEMSKTHKAKSSKTNKKSTMW